MKSQYDHIEERLSSNAKTALGIAEKIAREKRSITVKPIHLLLALLSSEGGIGRLLLKNSGIDEAAIIKFLAQRESSDLKRKRAVAKKSLPFSPELTQALSRAYLAASDFQSPYVGTEHIVFAVLEDPDKDIASIISQSQAKIGNILSAIEVHLGFGHFPNLGRMFDFPETAPRQEPDADQGSVLTQYTTDLGVTSASSGSEFFGRAEERDRIVRILGRKEKNNPLLIGEPGVGKTAIVSAIARSIISGTAPASLAGKRILALDLALVVSGTSFRGEFEARIKEIVREASQNDDIILFIDEIHAIVGAGNSQGGLDAANILKPALARGDIRVIGATTLSEYKRHIEKDPALDRRFQGIVVREPTPKETKELLKKAKRSYERFHGVLIPPSIVERAVDLSVRHIHDRFLPDKAIDILDEAASLVKSRSDSGSAAHIIASLKSERRRVLEQKEALIDERRFEDASLLLDEERKIHDEIMSLSRKGDAPELGVGAVKLTEEDLLATVSSITGVPFAKLETAQPNDRMKKLKSALRNQVIAQKEASDRVSAALARALSETRDPNRPIGSFLFLGPSGVGKTLLAKTLAEEFFGSASHLIRLDMSEFMERHSISGMIGAPAGYIGYGDGGRLTERVRRTPHSVVLFDEIEKAHQDVWNILLQILDEGMLTDAEGRRVSFRDTVVILTSNIGTETFTKNAGIGFSHRDKDGGILPNAIRIEVLEELKRTLRPELLARIGHTIVMDRLGKEAVGLIAEIELTKIRKRLAEKGVSVSMPKSLSRFIAEKSFSPEHGARLVRRNVEIFVEDPIAATILSAPQSGVKRSLKLLIHDGAVVCRDTSKKA